ncbi:hypothetical protein VBD025_02785 [Virgibacillus flavescens]|uniref:hypothetical protein n=1 Tax=Virgibacillus flavescens TaxID=1611422 RepID=UPI003D355630
MNSMVQRTQLKYRNEREGVNYSIIDIEFSLKTLAREGLIWTLQGMKDLTESEEVLILHYLNEFREEQIYDNVDNLITIP